MCAFFKTTQPTSQPSLHKIADERQACEQSLQTRKDKGCIRPGLEPLSPACPPRLPLLFFLVFAELTWQKKGRLVDPWFLNGKEWKQKINLGGEHDVDFPFQKRTWFFWSLFDFLNIYKAYLEGPRTKQQPPYLAQYAQCFLLWTTPAWDNIGSIARKRRGRAPLKKTVLCSKSQWSSPQKIARNFKLSFAFFLPKKIFTFLVLVFFCKKTPQGKVSWALGKQLGRKMYFALLLVVSSWVGRFRLLRLYLVRSEVPQEGLQTTPRLKHRWELVKKLENQT